MIKSPNQLNLGTAPRSKYPLVVFLIRVDDADEECPPDETVCVLQIVLILSNNADYIGASNERRTSSRFTMSIAHKRKHSNH